jgi:hypothetical protein
MTNYNFEQFKIRCQLIRVAFGLQIAFRLQIARRELATQW